MKIDLTAIKPRFFVWLFCVGVLGVSSLGIPIILSSNTNLMLFWGGYACLFLIVISLIKQDVFPLLAGLIALTPLERYEMFSGGGTIIPLFGLVVVTVWILILVTRKTRLIIFTETIPLLLFFISMLLSVALSVNIDISLIKSKTYIQLIGLTIIMMYTINSIRKFEIIIWIIIISNSLIAIYALATNSDRIYNKVYDTYRATGLSSDPNFAALQFTVAIPFILFMVFHIKNNIIRVLLLACTTVLILAVLQTQSVGGLIGLLVCFGLFFIYYTRLTISRILRGTILATLFFMIVATMIPSSLEQKLQDQLRLLETENALSFGTYRAYLWSLAWNTTLDDYPLWGVGPGNSGPVLYALQVFRSKNQAVYAHNTLLAVALEFGLVGLGAFILILIIAFRKLSKTINAYRLPPKWADLGRAVMVSLIAFLVQGLALDAQVIKALWILIGLAFVHSLLTEGCLTAKVSKHEDTSST